MDDSQSIHEFDVIIVGAGPGGYSTALRAAELGKRVALVEREQLPGGVCLHQGCVPSKALLTAAHIVREGSQASRMGLSMPLQSLDLGSLFAYKDGVVSQMTKGLQSLLRTRGVQVIHGSASLEADGLVRVSGSPVAGAESDKDSKDSVATGSNPAANEADPAQAAAASTTAEVAASSSPDLTSPALTSPTASPAEPTQPDRNPADNTLYLHAPDIVLATGSRPRQLPDSPFDQHAIISSQEALRLTQIPQSVIILGSGPVGLEFATFWRSFGAEVTVLEVADRLLPHESSRISALIARQLKREGINYQTRAVIDSLEEGVNQFATVHYHLASEPAEPAATAEQPAEESASLVSDPLTGQPSQPVEPASPSDSQSLAAQFVLVAIGRTPNTEADWFAQRGIQLDEQGLVVTDPYGRTSVKGIWALGDITAGKQLAHRAFAQGLVVAESIAGVETEPVDDHTVPSLVFTASEVASVGYTLEEAQTQADFSQVEETVLPTLGNSRVVMLGQTGSISLVCGVIGDDPTRRVLGVHMIGPGVSELAGEAQQLVGNRVPLHQAARLVHPHPTLSESLGEALLSADGRPLHSR